MSKDEIRHRVWLRMRAAGAACFPGAEGRVPNFLGAPRATALLRELTIWKRAKVIKISADAPQLPVRRAALLEGKIVYIAVPRLRAEKCFIELDPDKLGPARALRAASVKGALAYGRVVGPHEIRPVDLIVLGSVAVTRQGARVGKGGGFADLEYALLRKEGKVREYTPILTTVHPLQVIDERIPMRSHDTPVDFLVTPDQVIAAPSLHPRPRGVLWELLAEERIMAIPVLRKGRRELRGSTPRQL
jgi:5-formyltetrahydrofolate cyclo-ligase